MKIHLRDKDTPETEYKECPHIRKAIRDGDWSKCKIVATGFITDDISKVTCEACKKEINYG